jgi:hypothetical protein
MPPIATAALSMLITGAATRSSGHSVVTGSAIAIACSNSSSHALGISIPQ